MVFWGGTGGMAYMATAADLQADASIVLGMLERAFEDDERRAGRQRTTPDVTRHPRPQHRPRPDAQWDEAAGRWEVWSEAEQSWVSLEDGAVQEPGTRSVAPNEDALLRPAPIDLR